MYTVIQLPEFSDWLHGIKDRPTRIRLANRLRKAQLGNLGGVKTGRGFRMGNAGVLWAGVADVLHPAR